MKQRFVTARDVRLEVLVHDGAPGGRTRAVVLVPGLLAPASYWTSCAGFIAALVATGPRTIVAVSLRGRGASSAPATGWSLADHVADIAAAVDFASAEGSEGEGVVLIGHSVGGAYALAYALAHPARVVGVAVGDYPPLIPPVDDAWAAGALARRDPAAFAAETPGRLVTETRFEMLAPRLAALAAPLLVIRGTAEGAALDADSVALYGAARVQRIVEVPCGHAVFEHAAAQAACADLVAGRVFPAPA